MRYFNLFKNISNWWVHFQIKIGAFRNDSVSLATRNGIRFEVPTILIHAFKEIFMEECYTHGAPLKIKDGMNIVDVGANVGVFTMFAAMRFPNANIFSYEPIDANFRQLQKNASLNASINIQCFNKAIYSHSGEIVLKLAENDFSTTASLIGDSGGMREIKVACVGIKEIFDENKIESCDFLKMDCEGAEYDALFSCPLEYLDRIKRMAIEIHSGTKSEYNGDALRNYLEKHGFVTFETSKALGMLFAWK
ncbi:MAG: FkbM family methyltransferase [Deltaproteobacteria bacterium]